MLPGSDGLIRSIGLADSLHPDFSAQGRYGIPINIVGRTTPRRAVRFDYAWSRTAWGTRSRAKPRIEGGSDRHILLVDRDACRLYELFARPPRGRRRLERRAPGAVFDLASNRAAPGRLDQRRRRRPPDPARARALRRGRPAPASTTPCASPRPRTRRAYVYPARHAASDSSDPALPPMGLRVRLKARCRSPGSGRRRGRCSRP